MSNNPRAAVIGYGFAGRSFHSYLIDITPGLALRGVSSRNPETRRQIAADHNCIVYSGLDEVLADEAVDLVVLATPSSTHCELACQALDAGKHVVTDKVMCLSLAECDRMIAAAKRNDRLLTVFQNRRWDGDWLTLLQLRDAGELGRVNWLEMAWQGWGPMGRGKWRSRAEMGGGRFHDLGAHLVDQLLLFFPQAVESCYCRMHHEFAESDTESHCLWVVTFAGGATGVLDLGSRVTIKKPRFRAVGDRANFVKYGVDPQEQAMIAGDIDRAVEPPEAHGVLASPEGERRVPTLPGRWRHFYENVRDVLRGEAAPAVDLPSVRRAMALYEAARQSAASGQVCPTNIPALEDAP